MIPPDVQRTVALPETARQTTYPIAGFFYLNYLCVEVHFFEIVWLNVHDQSQDKKITYSENNKI